MARYLTGIQSSGIPHLGNILGAIVPAIQFSKTPGNESIFFIADYHSLTTIKSAAERIHNVRSVAAAWIAFGFDYEQNILFRQSDVKQVLELTWFLGCFTPYPMLANATSFKDKAEKLSDVNAGLFTYPVLMAADIILYDTAFVPVGKDQIQHIEMARDMASMFNRFYKTDCLVLPEPAIQAESMTVPGTDGLKMSKSYGNFIDIFQDDKALRKVVMSIKTNSADLADPKDPDTDITFKLYSLIASEEEIASLRASYLVGNFGYGAAKEIFYDKLLSHFGEARKRYTELMAEPEKLDAVLKVGAEKASTIANRVLERIRPLVGF